MKLLKNYELTYEVNKNYIIIVKNYNKFNLI